MPPSPSNLDPNPNLNPNPNPSPNPNPKPNPNPHPIPNPTQVVFGGFSKGKYFHDVHTLDVERLGWSQFIVTGAAPHGRVSHTATLVGEEVLIFG